MHSQDVSVILRCSIIKNEYIERLNWFSTANIQCLKMCYYSWCLSKPYPRTFIWYQAKSWNMGNGLCLWYKNYCAGGDGNDTIQVLEGFICQKWQIWFKMHLQPLLWLSFSAMGPQNQARIAVNNKAKWLRYRSHPETCSRAHCGNQWPPSICWYIPPN